MTPVAPLIPTALSPDVAAWWVTFYLTNMGPLYATTLREQGFGAAVKAVSWWSRRSPSARRWRPVRPVAPKTVILIAASRGMPTGRWRLGSGCGCGPAARR